MPPVRSDCRPDVRAGLLLPWLSPEWILSPPPWPIPAADLHRLLLVQGLSLGAVARIYGVSRGVVAGAADRAGVFAARRARRQAQAAAQRHRQPRGCRFIQGDPGAPGWRYCQQPRRRRSSYCPQHHMLCHRRDSGPDLQALLADLAGTLAAESLPWQPASPAAREEP